MTINVDPATKLPCSLSTTLADGTNICIPLDFGNRDFRAFWVSNQKADEKVQVRLEHCKNLHMKP